METKHIFIGDYINKNPKERIYHLMDNYKDFKVTGIIDTGGSEEDYVYM